MRRPALVAFAFLGLTAFGPPPADPAGPSSLTRLVGERSDHTWQPPSYLQQILPDADRLTPRGLGARSTCVPTPQQVYKGPCVPAANGWGNGTQFTYFTDGCGRTYQENASCYVDCPSSNWDYQPPSACAPSNGSMGPGIITTYKSNSCGAFWTASVACCVPGDQVISESTCMPASGASGPGQITKVHTDGCTPNNWNENVSCCVEGDQVVSESACVPNSGTFGPGRITKVHDNSCGRRWDEQIACEIPAPLPPPPSDEIVFCLDFESVSLRPMPFDYLGEQFADPNAVYGSPYNLRWDNRHQCIYKMSDQPPGVYTNGSPWFCTAWAHPNPSTGYCYMENPRYADFARRNAGERAVRVSIGEEGMWAGSWNGTIGWYGRGTIYYSDAQIEMYKTYGRKYDNELDRSYPGRIQRTY